LKKKKITDKIIIYNYSSDKNNIDGTVEVSREDLTLPPTFTLASCDNSLYFARQAMFSIVNLPPGVLV